MDSDQEAAILKVRKTLKSQITGLSKALEQKEKPLTRLNAELRLQNVTKYFDQFFELYNEISDKIPADHDMVSQFETVQDDYFALAAKVHSLPAPGSSLSRTSLNASLSFAGVGHSTVVEVQQQPKLPTINVPKFDSTFDNWLSWKLAFDFTVHEHKGIEGGAKFLHLRDALTGPAKDMIALLEPSEENYLKAREILTKAYEKKRILVNKHTDAIYAISPLTTATSAGLASIINISRQHISMLGSLGVKMRVSTTDGVSKADPTDPFHALIVRWLEKLLPSDVRQEWEKTLSLNELPTFEAFSDWVMEYSFRLANREQERQKTGGSGKRSNDHQHRSHKFKKNVSGARSLVTSTISPSTSEFKCPQCQQAHLLYQCPVFGKLNLSQRWETVKGYKLCINCLRSGKHPGNGKCPSGHCRFCPKYHHSLLCSKSNSSSSWPKPERKEPSSI